MNSSQIRIRAFGQIYALDRELLSQSGMLILALAESQIQGNQIDLNLDPSYQPAFEYIYNKLIGVPSSIINPSILVDVMLLADYLDVSIVMNELTPTFLDLVSNGYVLDQQLQEILKGRILAATHIIAQNSYFENLPVWIKPLFNYYQTNALPFNNDPILGKFLPQEANTNLRDIFLPNYGRKCQPDHQPQVIHVEEIANYITLGKQVGKFVDHNGITRYMTCPGTDFTNLGTTSYNVNNTGVCCFRWPQNVDGTPLMILNNNIVALLRGKKGYKTESGIAVFVDPSYVGDYIYATNYQIIPELNAVVVMQ